MPEFDPAMLEIGVPVLAGILYALIWYATRGLPGVAKVLARALPLIAIVPAVLYFSLGVPMPRQQAIPRQQATEPRMTEMPVPRDGGTASRAEKRPEVATAPAPQQPSPP